VDYVVVVVTVQKRFVTSDGPIDAISDALNYNGEVTNEQWERDEKIERVHVYVDDEEHKVRIPKKTLAKINNNHKDSMNEKSDFGKSWNEMIEQDIKKLPTVSLKEVAKLEFEATITE